MGDGQIVETGTNTRTDIGDRNIVETEKYNGDWLEYWEWDTYWNLGQIMRLGKY